MTTETLEQPSTQRALALKKLTHDTHSRLDKSIMAGRPFESRARYGLFLQVQYLFHRDIDALYSNRELDGILPDLDGRRRLALIAQDLADLGIPLPEADGPPRFDGQQVDIPTALGWLYVAEGSNLGAAFLLKAAAGLGLSETMGARHLAAAPEGRGLHWRTFTAALDGPEIDSPSEARVAAGAEAAFARVQALVDRIFAEAPEA
ncbi:biliverdin-producing heme oxygenase [Xanthobacter sp. TB0136]|uniref:biliverdin-producing heme oxygenase n=1 Tax=Xanthobacter sp. TB0136 TaxID=3459177 RepID=UPI004039A42C